MISAQQLKDKIKNIAKGDSMKAQLLLRNYMMERFLVRVALSEYKDNFILKGGMLVSAVVGIQARATMDIDTTVRALPLKIEETKTIVEKIIAIDANDGVTFEIKKVSDIMEEHDYPGIRLVMDARLENLKQAIKVDISTGDEITPNAIRYFYKLMFNGGELAIWAYNLETLLAEKLETVVARGTANTRMRDFYDIYTLWQEKEQEINVGILRKAFYNTANKRETLQLMENANAVLKEIGYSADLRKLWLNYLQDSVYAKDLEWDKVLETVR
ncbi:MAG: nucleotidyl transferase AbiEii/AbiGii toxin family protein, partial [Clostridia bacterium]|nr:nucleotidyl transferase AbiEii/AbiGii toxin family protein [Clostridia bacterium]